MTFDLGRISLAKRGFGVIMRCKLASDEWKANGTNTGKHKVWAHSFGTENILRKSRQEGTHKVWGKMDFWKADFYMTELEFGTCLCCSLGVLVLSLWIRGPRSFLHHMLHFRAASRHFDLGTVRVKGRFKKGVLVLSLKCNRPWISVAWLKWVPDKCGVHYKFKQAPDGSLVKSSSMLWDGSIDESWVNLKSFWNRLTSSLFALATC